MDQADLTKINPYTFDDHVQKFSDFAKSKGASDDEIKSATDSFRDAYQQANGGSAGSTGLFSSGFNSKGVDELTKSAGETPDAYRRNEADNSGTVLSPLQPGQNRLMGIPKVIPNVASDAVDIATGLINTVAHPINTVEDIYRNPAMLAGPVAQNLVNGSGNALKDLFEGNISKAGVDFLAGADKAWTGFVDHPILSLPLLKVLGIAKEFSANPLSSVKEAAGDAASKGIKVAEAASNPLEAAQNFGNSVIAPFKSLMPKATGDAAANIIGDRVKTTIGQINALDEFNKALGEKPDFVTDAKKTQDAISTLDVHKRLAEENLTKAQTEDTTLLHSLIDNTSHATADAVKSYIEGKFLDIEQQSKAGYENLKTKDGDPIPVLNTKPLVDSLQKVVAENGNMLNPDTFAKINDRVFLLKAQQLAGEGKSLPEIQAAMVKENPSNIVALQKQFDKYPANFLEKPLSADQLKSVRDGIMHDIQKGAPNPSVTSKVFGDALRSAFNQMLEESVTPVNPGGARSVLQADKAFSNLISAKEKYGISDDGSFGNGKKIEENFTSFQKDFPELAKAYQQMKGSEIVRDAQKISDAGAQSVDYAKLNKGLEENKNVLPTDLYAQAKSIVQKSYSDVQMRDRVVQGADTASEALQKQLKQIQNNEKVSPTSPEEFETKVKGLKTYEEMKQLSETSGLTPEQLGKVFMASSILKNLGEKPASLSPEKAVTGAKNILKEYDNLGGTSKTADLKNEMFGDTNAQMESLRKDVDRYDQAKKEGSREIIKNIGKAILGSTIGIGHGLIGGSITFNSIKDLIKPRVTESVPGNEGVFGKSLKKASKTIAQPATAAGNVQANKNK